MPNPQPIQVQTFSGAAARRVPPARLIRRPAVDAARIKAVLRSGSYTELLHVEVLAEEGRVALMRLDDGEADRIIRDIFSRASRIGRALRMLREIQP